MISFAEEAAKKYGGHPGCLDGVIPYLEFTPEEYKALPEEHRDELKKRHKWNFGDGNVCIEMGSGNSLRDQLDLGTPICYQDSVTGCLVYHYPDGRIMKVGDTDEETFLRMATKEDLEGLEPRYE